VPPEPRRTPRPLLHVHYTPGTPRVHPLRHSSPISCRSRIGLAGLSPAPCPRTPYSETTQLSGPPTDRKAPVPLPFGTLGAGGGGGPTARRPPPTHKPRGAPQPACAPSLTEPLQQCGRTGAPHDLHVSHSSIPSALPDWTLHEDTYSRTLPGAQPSPAVPSTPDRPANGSRSWSRPQIAPPPRQP